MQSERQIVKKLTPKVQPLIPLSPIATLRHFSALEPHANKEPGPSATLSSNPDTSPEALSDTRISGTAASAVNMLSGANPQIVAYAKTLGRNFHTPAQQVSHLIAAQLRKEWGREIDPDHTRIVTLNYDLKKPKPADGKVLNDITLTHAALSNVRSINGKDEYPTDDEKARQEVISVGDMVPFFAPLHLLGQYEKARETLSPKYEYIISGSASPTSNSYDASQVLEQTPQVFRDLVWGTELVGPYKSYLNTFWATHEKNYSSLSKIALAQAAFTQCKEGSLSEENAALVMKAAGLPDGKAWPDVSLAQLQAPYSRPANIEVGLVSINGDKSTDLMYLIDKDRKVDSTGKNITPTLLHIPGNSSPIQSFDSPEALKTWLADQAADPAKRMALLNHFKRNDQDNKVFSDGVNQSLIGLGGWRASQTPNALGFTGLNAWDPQRYISLQPVAGNPFEAVTLRQKERSYADADHDITTDGDVVKSAIVKTAEATTAAALMMTPLAILMPEVALALDAVYVGAGLVDVGVGIDDMVAGKSTGADRIVFGILNAAPGIVHGSARGGSRALETQAGEEVVRSAPSTPKGNTDLEVEEVFSDEAKQPGRQRITMDTSVRDLKLVDDSFFTFVDTYKGSDRLNVVVHGRELGFLEKKYSLPTDAVINGEIKTPEELDELLSESGIEPAEYDNVRLIMCYSGNGGDESFAAKFHQLIGTPVKAYVGPVEAVFNSGEIRELYDKALSSKRGIGRLERELTEEDQPVIIKDGTQKSKYRPVHFPARTG